MYISVAEVLDDGGEDGVFKDTLSALRPDQIRKLAQLMHTTYLALLKPLSSFPPSPFSFFLLSFPSHFLSLPQSPRLSAAVFDQVEHECQVQHCSTERYGASVEKKF